MIKTSRFKMLIIVIITFTFVISNLYSKDYIFATSEVSNTPVENIVGESSNDVNTLEESDEGIALDMVDTPLQKTEDTQPSNPLSENTLEESFYDTQEVVNAQGENISDIDLEDNENVLKCGLSPFASTFEDLADYKVSSADELYYAIQAVKDAPVIIELGADISYSTENKNTLSLPANANVTIRSDGNNRTLTLKRLGSGKESIHIANGAKLSLTSSTLTVKLDGSGGTYNYNANIINDGYLQISDTNVKIPDAIAHTIVSSGTIHLINSEFIGTTTLEHNQYTQGAFDVDGKDASLTVKDCTFKDFQNGAPIIVEMANKVVIENATFNNNGNSKDLIAPSALTVKNTDELQILNSVFTANAGYEGGALSLSSILKGQLDNVTMDQNRGYANGGGLYVSGDDSEIAIINTKITNNTLLMGVGDPWRSGGGGAFILGGKVTFRNCNINNNKTIKNANTNSYPPGGGLMVVKQGEIVISENTEISYNTAGSGGGIHSFADANNTNSVRLESAWIHHNEALTSEGGGLFANDYVEISLDKTLVRDNEASTEGGGLWTCAKGIPLVFEKNGIAIYDNISNGNKYTANTGNGSGRDILVSSTPGEKVKVISFSDVMLGGGDFSFYNDEGNDRLLEQSYHIKRQKSDPSLYTNKALNGSVYKPIAMESRPSEEAKKAAEQQATVIIENNKAIKGGGVALNGPMTSGQSYAKESLTVLKKWKSDSNHKQPIAVKVQLYRLGANNLSVPVGNPVVLNQDNSWEYEFKDLSTGYDWTVDEVSAPEGYAKKIVTSDDRKTITIENEYQKLHLLIHKQIADKDSEGNVVIPDDKAEFEFKVTIGNDPNKVYQYQIDDKLYMIKSGDEITLKHDQTAEFLNIPAETNYQIEEKDYYNHDLHGKNYLVKSKNAIGCLRKSITASFENTVVAKKYPVTMSSLVVVDRIISNPEDIDYQKYFDVNIHIGEDTTKTYQYQIIPAKVYAYYDRNDPQNQKKMSSVLKNDNFPTDDSFIAGIPIQHSTSNEIQVNMNHGSAVIIYNIPVGTSYFVNQSDSNDGYKIDSTVKTRGIILPDKDVLEDTDTADDNLLRVRADIFNYFIRPITYTIAVEKEWVAKGNEIPNSTKLSLIVNDNYFDSRSLRAEDDWKTSFTVTKAESDKKLVEQLIEEEVPGYTAQYTYLGTSIQGDEIIRRWKVINTANESIEPSNPDTPQEPDNPKDPIQPENKPNVQDPDKPNYSDNKQNVQNIDTGDHTEFAYYTVLFVLSGAITIGIAWVWRKTYNKKS